MELSRSARDYIRNQVHKASVEAWVQDQQAKRLDPNAAASFTPIYRTHSPAPGVPGNGIRAIQGGRKWEGPRA
jgi:hypothetical protein